ncbi:MAG: hypothetical protein AAGI13_15085, partial [Pseudomonadota bacterium]
EGTYLPGWGGIVADLTALHARMSAPPPLIGWDLIWGPKGPMVLEGNTGIGFHLFQLDRLAPSPVPLLGLVQ